MSSKIFSVNFNSFYLWIPLIFLLIFFNGINSSQTDCDDESCLECEDSIPSSCLLCNSSYFLDTMNHSCVEECNNHLVKEIKNISETLNKTCINCKDFNKIKIINKDEECYENDTNNTYGYFLSDSETNFYEPCYDTCASCVGFGNETKQNCLSCRNISEIPNEETNCVEKCFYTCENCTTHGDETNHRCTQCKESKLEEYSKNSYFNCIDECPPYLGTYREEGKCKNCKTMDLFKYLKDEQCINKTEGVYIINNYTENGTTINITGYNIIDDCYESCRICNQSGSNDTNNCLQCQSEYYPINNYPEIPEYEPDDPNQTKNCYNISTAPKEYYFDSNRSAFILCHSNCSSCLEGPSEESSNCKECKESFYPKEEESSLDKKNCFNSTPAHYYFEDNLYKRCFNSCDDCSKGGNETENNCNNCTEGYFPKYSESGEGIQKNCYNTSPDGYYFDNETKTYKQCHSNCFTCLYPGNDTENNCLNCKDNYFPLNKDKDEEAKNCFHGPPETSPIGYYFDNETNTFIECFNSCSECLKGGDDTNNNCYKCKTTSGYYPLSEDKEKNYKNCMNESPQGYFLDLDDQCYSKCYNTCEYCSIGGDSKTNNCTNCTDNYYPLDEELEKEDLKNCYASLSGYYLDNSTLSFKRCFESCKECPIGGNNETNYCSECNVNKDYYEKEDENETLFNCYHQNNPPEGYYFDNIQGKHRHCYETCSLCSEAGTYEKMNCNKCIEGYSYEVEDNPGICLTIDQHLNDSNYKEYYFNNETLMFNHCDSNCLTCEYNSTYCTSCISPTPFLFIENHTCVSDCTHFYIQDNFTCLNCRLQTKIKIYDDDYKCYSTIGEDYILIDENTDTYKQCYKTCAKCNEIGESDEDQKCLSCKGNFTELINGTNNCILICYDSCDTCDEHGFEDFHNCTKCSKEYFQLEEELNETYFNCFDYKKSPEGYYFNQTTEGCSEEICGVHKKCHPNCKTCGMEGTDEDNNCRSCIIDYYKKEDDDSSAFNCYNSTPEGYYFYDSNETSIYKKCYSSCKNCLFGGTKDINNCTECKDNETYQIEDDIFNNLTEFNCYSTSPDGYYLNIEEGMHKRCFNTCATCDLEGFEEENNCKKCLVDENYYPIFQAEAPLNCYSSPPRGYYFHNGTKTYQKCFSSCGTCHMAGDENNNNCEECYSDSNITYYPIDEYENSTERNCYSVSPDGYYLNENISMYSKCYYTCSKCNIGGDNETNGCSSCITRHHPKEDENPLSSKNCYNDTEPLEYYYIDISRGLFIRCYETCLFCSTSGSSTYNYCTECISNYSYTIEDKPNTCLTEEQHNNGSYSEYFLNRELDPPIYQHCDSDCLSCVNESSICTSCSGPLFLYPPNNTCVKNCTNYYVADKSIFECINCKDKDEIKLYEDPNQCYPNDYNVSNYALIDNDTNTYRQCYETCATCSEIGDSMENQHCDSCKDDKYMKVDENGNCVEKCYSSCDNCDEHGDEDNNMCTECREGFFQDYTKEGDSSFNCFDQCPPYLNPNYEEHKCENCGPSLKKYLEMDGCVDINKAVYPITEWENPKGEIIDITEFNIIGNCYSTCLSCEKPGNKLRNNCIECEEGFTAEPSTGNCLASCDYKFNGTCVERCETGYYANEVTRECLLYPEDYETDIVELDSGCKAEDAPKYAEEYVNNFTYTYFSGMSTLLVVCKDIFVIEIFKTDECQKATNENEANDDLSLSSVKLTGVSKKIIENNDGNVNSNEITYAKIDFFREDALNLVLFQSFFTSFKKGVKLLPYEGFISDFTYRIPLDKLGDYGYLNDKDKGIDFASSEHDFYNDFCFPYSKDGSDIILSDRREYLFPFNNFCTENCQFKGIDYEKNEALCNCEANKISYDSKKEIELNYGQSIIKYKKESISTNTLLSIKCFSTAFNSKYILKNIGFWVLLVSIFGLFGAVYLFFKISFVDILGHLKKLDKKDSLSDNKKENNRKFGEKDRIKNNPPPKGDEKKKKKTGHHHHHSSNKNNQNRNQSPNISSNTSRQRMANDTSNIGINNETNIPETGRKMEIEMQDLSQQREPIRIRNQEEINESPKNKEKKNYSEEKYTIEQYDDLSFKKAIQFDKRESSEVLLSILMSKLIILYVIPSKSVYDPIYLRLSTFVIVVVSLLFINSLLFTDTKISDRFKNEGSKGLGYVFSNEIGSVILASLIGFVVWGIIYYVMQMRKKLNIIIFRYSNDSNTYYSKIKEQIGAFQSRLAYFFVICLFFYIFFWYYITAFCGVFQEAQKGLMWWWLISFIFLIVWQLIFSIFIFAMRVSGISSKKPELYDISQILN